MASDQTPFPHPLFSEANPPWPAAPPPEPSLDHVLLFFSFSLIVLILYFCCYPLCQSSFRRSRRPIQRRDIETGLHFALRVAQPMAVRVVIEEELKSFQYSAEEPVGKNSDCCVCMDDFTAGDFCKMIGDCGHSFHGQCIITWLKINPHCPICRVPVPCGWKTEISDSEESTETSDSPRRTPD